MILYNGNDYKCGFGYYNYSSFSYAGIYCKFTGVSSQNYLRKCGYFEYAGSMVTICDHKSALRVEGSGEVEFQGKVIASGLPKGKVEALTSYRTIGMIAADGGEGNQGWYRLRVYLG